MAIDCSTVLIAPTKPNSWLNTKWLNAHDTYKYMSEFSFTRTVKSGFSDWSERKAVMDGENCEKEHVVK